MSPDQSISPVLQTEALPQLNKLKQNMGIGIVSVGFGALAWLGTADTAIASAPIPTPAPTEIQGTEATNPVFLQPASRVKVTQYKVAHSREAMTIMRESNGNPTPFVQLQVPRTEGSRTVTDTTFGQVVVDTVSPNTVVRVDVPNASVINGQDVRATFNTKTRQIDYVGVDGTTIGYYSGSFFSEETGHYIPVFGTASPENYSVSSSKIRGTGGQENDGGIPQISGSIVISDSNMGGDIVISGPDQNIQLHIPPNELSRLGVVDNGISTITVAQDPKEPNIYVLYKEGSSVALGEFNQATDKLELSEYFVKNDNTNFRTGPGTEYSADGSGIHDQPVEVIEELKNGWSKVKVGGEEKYVKSNLLYNVVFTLEPIPLLPKPEDRVPVATATPTVAPPPATPVLPIIQPTEPQPAPGKEEGYEYTMEKKLGVEFVQELNFGITSSEGFGLNFDVSAGAANYLNNAIPGDTHLESIGITPKGAKDLMAAILSNKGVSSEVDTFFQKGHPIELKVVTLEELEKIIPPEGFTRRDIKTTQGVLAGISYDQYSPVGPMTEYVIADIDVMIDTLRSRGQFSSQQEQFDAINTIFADKLPENWVYSGVFAGLVNALRLRIAQDTGRFEDGLLEWNTLTDGDQPVEVIASLR